MTVQMVSALSSVTFEEREESHVPITLQEAKDKKC